MTDSIRVFVNGAPVDVERGADVRGALRAHDPALEGRYDAGTALVTDARGIALDGGHRLAAGSILRVIVRAKRSEGDHDADA